MSFSPSTEFERMLVRVQIGPQVNPRPTPEGFRFMAAYELREKYKHKHLDRCRARFCCFPLDQLRGLPRATIHVGNAGVYFMWHGPELIYIGKAVQIGARLWQHKKANPRKPFTHVTYLTSDDALIRKFEATLVMRYAPPFNFTRTG